MLYSHLENVVYVKDKKYIQLIQKFLLVQLNILVHYAHLKY